MVVAVDVGTGPAGTNGFCRPMDDGSDRSGPSGCMSEKNGFLVTSAVGSNFTFVRDTGTSGTATGARLVEMNQYVNPATAIDPKMRRRREKTEGAFIFRASRPVPAN